MNLFVEGYKYCNTYIFVVVELKSNISLGVVEVMVVGVSSNHVHRSNKHG